MSYTADFQPGEGEVENGTGIRPWPPKRTVFSSKLGNIGSMLSILRNLSFPPRFYIIQRPTSDSFSSLDIKICKAFLGSRLALPKHSFAIQIVLALAVAHKSFFHSTTSIHARFRGLRRSLYLVSRQASTIFELKLAGRKITACLMGQIFDTCASINISEFNLPFVSSDGADRAVDSAH